MKKQLSILLTVILVTVGLTGCGGKSAKEVLEGEWFVWHWYYDVDNGEDGFFDDAKFYTFSPDGTLIIKESKDAKETENAKYEWKNDSTITVTHTDDTVETIEITVTTHEGKEQLKYKNTDTNYVLSLEHMSDWQD